ncbi:ABC transporter [Microbispora cellulosiformans]|uniref:ABC transporter n=1 Tax=Microbispora cellulosiformans TaxID=2614688 RepID=A0A5J5JT25_9ACTN|nr:YfjP family GTPase [Microbispora cellulosiformans]KAA9374432.1 ABC transporter [Microbispora cellulosiformans]
MKLLRRKAEVSLDDRLEALAEAADLAEGRLGPDTVERARAVVTRAGVRRGLSVDHTAVALAGATGSGKSSLFNALSGTDLATVGVTRPTTSKAQAALWGPDGSGPLLDWLGVPLRHTVEGESPGLILLDLPDHDSIELSHREEVDRLVAVVDLLVWVLDPQKYADAVVHERYLRPLARHRDVMVVVLNQVDRLPEHAVKRCLDDLRGLLADDGLDGVPLLAVSARTGAGLPELRKLLEGEVSRRRAWSSRLAADVASSAAALWADTRPAVTADAPVTVRALAPGPDAPALTAARLSASAEAEARVPSLADTAPSHAGARAPETARQGPASTGPAYAGMAPAGQYPVPAPGDVVVPEVTVSRALTRALAQAAGVPVVVEAVAKSHRHRSTAATGWPVTRWLRKLRPDPLRRLHLARGSRSSLPPATAVQASALDTALRDVGVAASAGVPEPWATAVRHAARSRSGELTETLDRVVATVSGGVSRPPRWWRVAGAAQWLTVAAMAAGAIWLLVVFGLDYLMLPRPFTPTLGRAPWPTVLLIGGALLGVLIALVCRAAAWLGGRRRARRAAKALRARIEQVAAELVITPTRDELTRYARFAECVTVAAS